MRKTILLFLIIFDLYKTEICQNGGIYDGTKCKCNEDLFYGPKCEFPVDDFPVPELSVTFNVEAQVKVTNKQYNSSLEDLRSNYSLEIQKQFKTQMEVVYRDVPGYLDVEILRMRNGSIIVEHKVIFQVEVKNNEEKIKAERDAITEEVRKSLTEIHNGECVMNSGPNLCFVPLPNPIINSTFSLNDPCKKINEEYADFYYSYTVNGTMRCISKCFKGAPDSMNCFNGVCRFSKSGPYCVCKNLDMFWYLDTFCQNRIEKTAVGLGLALAILFVVSIILTVFFIRNKQKKSKNRWFDDAEVWYGQETEEEWIPSAGLIVINKPAISTWNEFQNEIKSSNNLSTQ